MPGFLRVIALVVVGLLLVLVVAAVAVYAISESKLNRTLSVPTESVAVPTDTTSVQRGQHLAASVATCIDCHGPTLGGKIFVDDPALGRVIAPNLTRGRGGVGATSADADFVRALRHGVDPSGKPLLVMPSDDYKHFSDADLGAIIAYVRSLPPVTPEYGQYLADNAGCPSCHGPGLSGGKIPQAPPDTVPAANITSAGLGAWSEADFLKALRTGMRPDGRVLNTFMP